MLNLIRVAVTGGIASGKSTVTRIFQKLGAYVVSADQIAHQLLSTNTALNKQITSILGTRILVGGCIDRKKMAEVVFQSPELLHKVEAVIHPMVVQEIEKQWKEAASSGNYPLFVAEVPLLFEAKMDGWYDETLAVLASEDDTIARFCDKTGYDRDEYQRRAALQLTPAAKAAKAKFVIENKGSLDELEREVTSLYTTLSKGENLDV